ncbi:MAG: hypothetical protein GKR89_11690 [Candidatus Latescibacteria bacterium]|nr:hypothetical protein [Candidatus Latescibacterota bacterium]
MKKYFYVLRPVLACLWIERGLDVVPIEFATLVDRIVDDPILARDINRLLQQKRQGGELKRGPRIEAISDFLDSQLTRLSAAHQQPGGTKDPEPLDRLFVGLLEEMNGRDLA